MEGVHKAYKEEPAKAHDGTKEYTSIDAHKGNIPGEDDVYPRRKIGKYLHSIYTLIYPKLVKIHSSFRFAR